MVGRFIAWLFFMLVLVPSVVSPTDVIGDLVTGSRLSVTFHGGKVKITTSFMIKSGDVTSKTRCAGMCAVNLACKSFFYSLLGGTCQLHSEVMVNTDRVTSFGHVQYYYRDHGPRERMNSSDVEKTRILFAPSKNPTPLYLGQLYLADGMMTTYSYLNLSSVSAMIFVASRRKIVLATQTPYKVSFFPLDGSKATTVTNSVSCRAMALDEKRQLIFLAHDKPYNGVSSMTSHGENVKLVCRYRLNFHDIEVDPKRQILFFASFSRITIVTYLGTKRNILAKAAKIHVVMYDALNDFLYFTSQTNMMRVPVSSFRESPIFVTSLKGYPNSFVYHDDTFYVSIKKSQDISIHFRNGTVAVKKTNSLLNLSKPYLLLTLVK